MVEVSTFSISVYFLAQTNVQEGLPLEIFLCIYKEPGAAYEHSNMVITLLLYYDIHNPIKVQLNRELLPPLSKAKVHS